MHLQTHTVNQQSSHFIQYLPIVKSVYNFSNMVTPIGVGVLLNVFGLMPNAIKKELQSRYGIKKSQALRNKRRKAIKIYFLCTSVWENIFFEINI